jgi:ABC-type amino acid transport substrate-binding protein
VSRASIRLVVALAASAAVSGQFDSTSSHAYPRPELNQQATAATPQQNTSQSTASLEMPITFQRHLGDLNGMANRRQIRALVVPSRSGFFYDKGQPRGIFYEAMEEFQRFANLKLKTGSLKIHVIYIPVRGEQIQTALLEGVGDVLAYGAIVTPEREKLALFTAPIATNVN